MSDRPLITLNNVVAGYVPGVDILNGVNLEAARRRTRWHHRPQRCR